MRAHAGDRLLVRSGRHGDPGRHAEVLEAHGEDDGPPYLVRWGDGHVALYAPGEQVTVEHRPECVPAPPKRTSDRGDGGRLRRGGVQVTEAPRRLLTAAPGDHLLISPHVIGEPGREAEVLEVRGEGGSPPFLVRWEDDGAVGLVFPGPDARVRHSRAAGPAADDSGQMPLPPGHRGGASGGPGGTR